jgi:hypothetical protein
MAVVVVVVALLALSVLPTSPVINTNAVIEKTLSKLEDIFNHDTQEYCIDNTVQ